MLDIKKNSLKNVFYLCAAVNCPPPHIISNGHRSSSNNQYAAIVNYTCNAGYQLIGAPILFCLSTGQWTASAPECISMYRWLDLFDLVKLFGDFFYIVIFLIYILIYIYKIVNNMNIKYLHDENVFLFFNWLNDCIFLSYLLFFFFWISNFFFQKLHVPFLE